jgi:hypothetical protein
MLCRSEGAGSLEARLDMTLMIIFATNVYAQLGLGNVLRARQWWHKHVVLHRSWP